MGILAFLAQRGIGMLASVGCELIIKANLGSLRRMEMRKKERFQVGLYL